MSSAEIDPSAMIPETFNHSRKKRANVFLVHTSFQYLVVNHMLASMPEFHNFDNCLVLEMAYPWRESIQPHWHTVFALNTPVGASVIGSGAKCRSAIQGIRTIAEQYDFARFFVSDIAWPLNNAVYGLKRSLQLDHSALCQFPDGMGSLIVAFPNRARQLRNILKTTLRYFGGSPYYAYKGDIMGFAVSDRIYSLMPELIRRKTTTEVVAIPAMTVIAHCADEVSCMFLGQNYETLMSPEEHRRMCYKAAGYTSGLGYQNLIYKPHHFATTDVERNIFEEHGFSTCQDRRPIEEIFLTRQVPCVVSYNSSALVHLKMMFGDNVRCISYYGEHSLASTRVTRSTITDLLALFRLCGVERCDE